MSPVPIVVGDTSIMTPTNNTTKKDNSIATLIAKGRKDALENKDDDDDEFKGVISTAMDALGNAFHCVKLDNSICDQIGVILDLAKGRLMTDDELKRLEVLTNLRQMLFGKTLPFTSGPAK